MTSLSNAGIAQRMSDMVALWDTREREFREWTAGTPEGGPYGDGRYPLSSSTGTVYYIPCPASLAREVTDPAAKAVLLAAQAEAAKIAAATSAVRAEEAQAQALAQRNQASTERASAETARLGAQASEANAQVYRDQARDARDAAAATAVQVQEGLDATTAAVDSVVADATAAGAAQVALAETARNAAQTARTGAETAKTGAETAKTAAETARADAQTAASQAAASAASVVPSNLMHIAGNETATGIKSFNQQININALAGANAHLYLRDDAGVQKGLLYWDRAGGRIRLRRYNADASAAEGELTLTSTDLLWNGQPALLGTVTNAADNTALPSTYTPFIATGSMVASAPTGGAATHLTWRSNSDNRSAQIVTSNAGGTGNPDIWFRTHHTSDNGGGWTAFAKLWHSRLMRLQADFSSPIGTRSILQTNVTDGVTNVAAMPLGAGTHGIYSVFGSSDLVNNSGLQMVATGAAAYFNAAKLGNGAVPSAIGFRFDGAEKVSINNAGDITSSGSVNALGDVNLDTSTVERRFRWTNMTGGRSVYLFGIPAGTVGMYDTLAGRTRWSVDTNGNFAIDQNGKLSLGTQTRQMIDLWNTSYGIGVQNSTAYIRTGNNFAVFINGTHSNTENDPGTGGSRALFMNTTHGMFLYNGWFRSQQSGTGWYHEAHGGGWYMNDAWMRNYNNKVPCITTNQGTVARWESPSPTFEFYDTDNGVTSWLHMNGGYHGFLQNNAFGWATYRDDANRWICIGDWAAYASDERLKKNFMPLREELRDAFFDGVRIQEYDWSDEEIRRLNPGFHPTSWHEVGGSAQQFESVYAPMVHTRPAPKELEVELGGVGIKTLKWEKATPFLIAEVQELRKLKPRIAELEGQLQQVLARLNQLENRHD